MTEEGIGKIKQLLEARISELEGMLSKQSGGSYDNFNRGFNERWKVIEERYDRYDQMYEYLIDEDLIDEEEHKECLEVAHYALMLSGLEGNREDIYERAEVVDDFLYYLGWEGAERFRIISSVAIQEGDINNLSKNLVESFVLIQKNKHTNSYETWVEAAEIMKLAGNDLRKKYERFEEMVAVLGEIGWEDSEGDIESVTYLASHLIKRDGSVEDIANEFRNLELKLIEKAELNDCFESGVAALILMEGEGTLDEKAKDEKAKRFAKTKKIIEKEWDVDDKMYACIAAVSTMPGLVKENVQLHNEVYKKITEDDMLEDSNGNLAVTIMGARYVFKSYLSSLDRELDREN